MDNKTINQLIGKYDQKQLKDLVSYIVSKNQAAQQALLEYCQKQEKTVKTDNYDFVIEKKLKKHWEKASVIIEKFDMYGGGPESDEEDACDELEKMAELFENNQVSWEVRKTILDEMLEFVASDNSGFTDYLVDIAFIICKQKEEKIYLADYLGEYANCYYRGLAAKIYLENGEDEKFIESKKANLQYGSDYLELAGYYKKHGDEEQAIKIVLEGLDKCTGRLDEIYQYLFAYYKKRNDEAALEKLYADSDKRRMNQDTITEFMYQYYKEKGNYEKQKNALLKLLSCDDNRGLHKLYQRCKQDLKNEDFEKEENKILLTIKKRNLTVYFDILMEKNQTKEVIEYITQHQQYSGWGLDAGHYFSKRLSATYPREVLEMYWNEATFYVRMGKEKNYRHAVGVLKEIRKIMENNKWLDEWDTRYKAFLKEHSRKKLLLKELESF